MTIIVGLTGGIASGKTTISDFLKKKNYKVHNSDFEVDKIYSKPNNFFLKHLRAIGLSHSIKQKKINKITIREEIFKNKKTKTRLEKFIHNEVQKSRKKFLNKYKKNQTKIIFLDVPLLFEKKLDKICDICILMYAPQKIREKRALKRQGITKKIFRQIMKSQMKESIKKKKADYIINTSNSKKNCYKKIINIVKSLEQK